MHPNIPPHVINEASQHYYASPIQQNTTPYNHYANQTGYYPALDQRYAMPQGQPSPLVMPLAQPVIIFASPTGAAYQQQFLPPGHQALYYQEMSQQTQMVLPNRRLSVAPLRTSTPFPVYPYQEHYNTSRNSNDSLRSTKFPAHFETVEEDVSTINEEDTIEAPAKFRNQYNSNQQRGRGQYQHKQQVRFGNAGNRQRNYNSNRTPPGHSLLKSKSLAKSTGCLASVGTPSGYEMRPNRGMSNRFSAKSTTGLNNFADAHNFHGTQGRNGQPHYAEDTMNRNMRRRSVSTLNLAAMNIGHNEYVHGRRR